MESCKKCLFFLCGLHFLFPIHSSTFTSLDNIQQYADQLEEYPEADNITQLIDWLDPSYKEFHKYNVPGLFDHILTALWIKAPGWESKDFQDLLNDVVKQREQKGYKGRFIQKYVPDSDEQFILFGNVHGAFHSLVRNLQELKRQGIINDSLKIIKDNYRIVFIGNIIDRSPFVLETLMLVMRLMFENPDNVFNIRGDHEDNQKWLNFALRDELQLRISNHAHEDVPLQSLVDRLFNTLPLAIYLVQEQTEKNIDVVRISSDGLASKELDERKYYCFFSPENENEVFDIGNGFSMQCRTRVNLKAVLHVKRWSLSAARGEYWGPEIYPSGGLQFIGKHNGIAQWAIMSSPTNTGRRLFGFNFDSFVDLQTKGDINNWKLTVFNRDLIKDDNGFIEQTFFLVPKKDKPEFKSEVLLPMQPVVEKRFVKIEAPIIKEKEEVTLKEEKPAEAVKEKPIEKEKKIIEVGCTLDLSKGLKDVSKAAQSGMDAVFRKTNKGGGIHGRRVEVVYRDDEYTPDKAQNNIKEFLNQGIDIILSPPGSPTLAGYLNFVKEKKVLVLFPLVSSPTFQKTNLENLILFRPSAEEEGYAGTKYVLDTLNRIKFAFFYQSDLGEVLKGSTTALKEAGIKDWLEVPYFRNDVEFLKQVKKIEEFRPLALGFFGTSLAAQSLIRQIGVNKLLETILFGNSDYSEESFRNFIEKRGLTFISANDVPSPTTSELEIVKEFRAVAQEYNISQNSFALEGYINAAIFVYVLEQIKGPITKEAIIEVIEKIKDLNFKGLKLNFDPKTRRLSHTIWLDTGKGEWEAISLKVEKEEKPTVEEKPAVKEKVAKKGIVAVGSILPLTKQFKVLGVIIKQVMDAVIGQINKEGGINGKKIDMTILDDEYTVEITKGKVQTLLQQNIHILLNPFGSPTLESYLDLVRKKELAVLFPLASARFPNTPYVVRFRVSVVDEGYLLAKYCVNQLSGKKIAVFYQNDVFGNAGLEGVIKYLKEKGMSDWLEVPFQRNLVAFEKQVNQIKTYKPDSIIFITGSISVKAFIRQIGVQFLADENLLGICDLSEESFKRFTKEMGLNFILSSIVPNAEYSQLEIVKEFRKDAVLLDFPINSFALETYIGLKIFVYLIEHIDGPINQDSVISAAQNIKNVDFKGLQLNYIRETGQLFNKLWLDTGKDEWESISLKEEIKETEQEKPAEIKEEKKGTISVGSVLPLTKLFKPYGVAAKNVMDAVIGEINKEGGVNGRIIDMTILDDEYIAEVTKERIQSLLQQNIHILLNPYGSPTLESYLDSVRKKELAVLFPLASAVFPNAPYVVRFRVSVVDEGYLLAKYCVNQLSGKKIAIFYQNDVFGKSGLEGVIKYLKEKGISNWEEVPFQSESVAFEKQVNQIKTYKPDSIIFIASSISAKALIRQIGAKFLSGKNLLGNDDLSEQSFTRFTKEMGLNFVVSSVVPNAKHSQLKIVQEFRKDAEILDFPINSMALETYIGLKLFVYLIEQIDGQITQDSIISAAQNVKNVDFKGLNLNYVKKTGQLFDKVWLNTGKDEWEVISLKEEAEEPAEIREKPAVVEERPKKVEEKPQVAKEKPLEEVKPAEKIKEEELGERQSVIKVGTTLALTKYLRDLGKSLDDGLKLGINQINKTCVDGPRIDLTTLDDYYVPSKAQENVQRLLSEYGTNIIISPLGSPTLEKYLDLVEQGKILVLFPSTGAPIFRKPDLKNIIHYRISFFNEAYELTKYFIEQLGLKKMAFFYQDDAYGRGPLEGARAALKDSGINDWIEIPYSRGQTDFEKEVKKIKEKSFEVLGLFSVAISSIEFIRQADIPTFMGKRLYGISPIGERTFTTFLKRHNLKIVLAYPFPNPETSDLEIAKEFRTLAKQQGISLSTYSLEGYINASLFGYLLSKVKGFITNEKIISAAESIKNYNFKGLELNFDPQLRQLSNTLWIDFGQKDWKKVTLGKQEK